MHFIQERFLWNFPTWLSLKGAILGSGSVLFPALYSSHSPGRQAGGVLTLQGRKPGIGTQG